MGRFVCTGIYLYCGIKILYLTSIDQNIIARAKTDIEFFDPFFYSTNSQSGNCMTILHCLLVLFVFAFWMLNTYMYIVLKWCSKIITHSEARELVHSLATINIQRPAENQFEQRINFIINLGFWSQIIAVTHSQLYKHM